MHVGDDNETPESGLPAPDLDDLLAEVGAEVHHDAATDRPANAPATPPPPDPAAATVAESAAPDDPAAPLLPASEARAPEPIAERGTQPTRGSSTWYRTDEDRNKSVFRRANPWYRRLARGVIGLTFLAAAALGLYYGARQLQDWINRDRLPAAGPDVPSIRATSFQVRSTAPAPEVDGTITLDTETGAYEFVGRSGGSQAGLQVVSPDGRDVFVRRGATAWQTEDIDGVAAGVERAVGYLIDDDTADAILTNRLRRGYAELQNKTTEGLDDDALERYAIEIDTRAFSNDYPLQWQDYQSDAIPGVRETPTLPATIWLDQEDVLVRVQVGVPDEQFWSWQRLTYSDQPFDPSDPSTDPNADVVEAALGLLPCSPDNGVDFFTRLDTCAEAIAAGRELAVANGLAAVDDLVGADIAFTTVCRAIQNDAAVRTALLPGGVELAARADADGVCPGDLSRLESGDS